MLTTGRVQFLYEKMVIYSFLKLTLVLFPF